VPAEKTERNRQIIQAYARGQRQSSIAEEHGITQQTVSEIITRHRATQGPVDKAEEISRASELLDVMIEEAMALVALEGAPVTAGKDGLVVVDPERKGPHGEPVYVRDYSGRLAAIDRVRSLLERKAKLLGLDSATKTEVSGEVTYVIPGLDPSTLQ
jgi:transposase-like protein